VRKRELAYPIIFGNNICVAVPVGVNSHSSKTTLINPSGITVKDYQQLLGYSNSDLGRVDPVIQNLLVAKSISALAELDISHYQRLADTWADEIRAWLPQAEKTFWKMPEQRWRNDVTFYRLGMVHQYLEQKAKIEYKEDQRLVTKIRYTDPSLLFLNGVMDTRRGTCANMAVLHLAIGWRMGWPVSLACAKSHCFLRYDDGMVQHNIEATQSGYGGFRAPSDETLIKEHQLPLIAISSGSDLRVLKPREMLGVFVGFRARHMRDIGEVYEAEQSFLLARWLYPTSRRLYIDAMAMAVPQGEKLFDPCEIGSPLTLADLLYNHYGRGSRESMNMTISTFSLGR
jgi:hypothetical protein